ncbi:MAG: tRNA (adenosine(37)-N6)-threonylcarbamoyltransferase complex transferase subunit TsaD, partial [Candidatus Levyibacteriota bacterium]
MKILGIETSCDETAAAVIEGEGNRLNLLSNVIASSLELHTKTGGIIPEQAAREQVKYMLPVLRQALKEANTTMDAIDAFAITYGPGLIGSLLVGVETAKTLAYTLNKPIIPVNHMVGHLYANFIDNAAIA